MKVSWKNSEKLHTIILKIRKKLRNIEKSLTFFDVKVKAFFQGTFLNLERFQNFKKIFSIFVELRFKIPKKVILACRNITIVRKIFCTTFFNVIKEKISKFQSFFYKLSIFNISNIFKLIETFKLFILQSYNLEKILLSEKNLKREKSSF